MIKKIISFLLPDAEINFGADKKRQGKLVEAGENSDWGKTSEGGLPLKRFNGIEKGQVIKKRKMFELSDTDQESVKVSVRPLATTRFNEKLPMIIETTKKSQITRVQHKTRNIGVQCSSEQKKFFSFPSNILNSLPCTKRKQSFLKILPIDGQQTRFNKIFQLQNLNSTYSSFDFHLTPARTFSSKPDQEEKSLNDSISIVTDSFITPEDSPLLQASPSNLKISRFELESPLTHIQPITSIDNWGKLKDNNLLCSPFFPTVDSNKTPEIKSNILFPPINEEPEENEPEKVNEVVKTGQKKSNAEGFNESVKIEGMELLLSKENSLLNENMEVVDKGPQIAENPGFGNVFKPQNKTEFPCLPSSFPNSVTDLPAPQVMLNNSIASFSSNALQDTSNPFLNVSQATVTKPLYVFGSGTSNPPTTQFASVNPFLANPFK